MCLETLCRHSQVQWFRQHNILHSIFIASPKQVDAEKDSPWFSLISTVACRPCGACLLRCARNELWTVLLQDLCEYVVLEIGWTWMIMNHVNHECILFVTVSLAEGLFQVQAGDPLSVLRQESLRARFYSPGDCYSSSASSCAEAGDVAVWKWMYGGRKMKKACGTEYIYIYMYNLW